MMELDKRLLNEQGDSELEKGEAENGEDRDRSQRQGQRLFGEGQQRLAVIYRCAADTEEV